MRSPVEVCVGVATDFEVAVIHQRERATFRRDTSPG